MMRHATAVSERENRLKIYSTAPQSINLPQDAYVQQVIDVSRWSEEFGCEGILIYTDNGLVDPWLTAQVVVQNTERICPLVAVQPIYMHPYWIAKQISTIAYFHGRRLALNMLAGGFKNDLVALGDDTPHDDRYVRTTEYTQIISRLLEAREPVTFSGKYYSVSNLKLAPPLPAELFPEILISGSSDAGMAAAEAIGATAIRYPKPPEEEREVTLDGPVACGIRVGIIARTSADEAWRVAHERFPEDRKGQITHQLAMKVSDSFWHKQLASDDTKPKTERSTYWLGPFENYKTFCPYLVGTYEQVGREIAGYYRKGYRTIILDIPPSREELEHIGKTFSTALELATQ